MKKRGSHQTILKLWAMTFLLLGVVLPTWSAFSPFKERSEALPPPLLASSFPSPAPPSLASPLAQDLYSLTSKDKLTSFPFSLPIPPIATSYAYKALEYAIQQGTLEWIPYLVQMGANPNAKATHYGQPFLALATIQGNLPLLKALLEAGANPNVCLPSSSPSFVNLAQTRHLKKMLQEDEKLTPLMIAASHGDLPTLRTLLAYGAKTNLFTRKWKFYAINFAVVQKHLDTMQLLLGIDPDTSDEPCHAIISLSQQRVIVKKKGETIASSPVSTGRRGYRTPRGEYVITNKHRHWRSTLYHSSMPYFMRLNCGSFGLHAGRLPGYPASHGCIRMPYHKAKHFFSQLPVGTRVSIVD